MQGNIRPFGEQEAAKAADLFNKAGRKRGSRFDCFIAATAVIEGAEVATNNHDDFKAFVPFGLKLIVPATP